MTSRNGRVRGVTRREPVLPQQASEALPPQLPPRRDLMLCDPATQRCVRRELVRIALPKQLDGLLRSWEACLGKGRPAKEVGDSEARIEDRSSATIRVAIR
jgi:hypothetical protein